MTKYRVEKNSFILPPEDSYFLDLVWIEQVEGAKGPYLRWYWKIAEIPTQLEYSKCRASSQTSLTPTLGNRFGEFLKVIYGDLKVNDEGDVMHLVKIKVRVKGFIEHSKDKEKDAEKGKEKRVFCNVLKIIENTCTKGVGIGCLGAPKKMRPQVNEWLKSIGEPALPAEEDDANVTKTPNAVHAKPITSTKDIPW